MIDMIPKDKKIVSEIALACFFEDYNTKGNSTSNKMSLVT